MRLHRFYISEKIGSKKEVVVNSAELADQIFKVFRLKSGDSVFLFDGSGNDYECTIGHGGSNKKDKGVVFEVVSSMKSPYLSSKEVILCAAITKKDTFEWIVQKATELGVTKIIPVLAERSEKKSLNIGRLNKISIEASEQSGRGSIPEILEITDLSGALSAIKAAHNDVKAIVFHTDAQKLSQSVIDSSESNKTSVAVFIGPEGGWSATEIDAFHKNNCDIYCLGSQILRAETAVIASLSLVLLGK